MSYSQTFMSRPLMGTETTAQRLAAYAKKKFDDRSEMENIANAVVKTAISNIENGHCEWGQSFTHVKVRVPIEVESKHCVEEEKDTFINNDLSMCIFCKFKTLHGFNAVSTVSDPPNPLKYAYINREIVFDLHVIQ